MYTEEEIQFMKSLGLDFDYSDLSDDDYFQIEEVVGDALNIRGLDADYYPNKIGALCYQILDKLP